MAVNLSPVGGVAAQFFTNSGAPLTGGKIFTYAAGTTTPQASYTTSQGNVAWTNPIVLDAAGRVPSGGEIWLTDGLIYKFILKDANDVLIATYDNISGINSNFVAFVNQQEIVTATAGQTVFNLGINYQPATNSLSVFVDGVNQYGPGAQYSYVETDSNTVTFNAGLHVGAEVKFTTTQQQSAGAVDAQQVTYDPPFTGSVATNVEAKLAQTVSVTDFGAVGDGVADDTTAFTSALAASYNVYVPAGQYKITSTLSIPAGTALRGANRESAKILHAFNGDLINFGANAVLSDLWLAGQGSTYIGQGVVYSGTDGGQTVQNCKIVDFAAACLYFYETAGAQSNTVNLIASQTNGNTGTGNYAIVIRDTGSAYASAVPRKFVNIETNGACSFFFGSSNDTFVSNSFLGDLFYATSSRASLVTGCRIANQAALLIQGNNHTIVGCDIAPQITIQLNSDNIALQGNSYNLLPIVNNSGNSRNLIDASAIAYTPVLTTGGTSPSLGNGTIAGTYCLTGSVCCFELQFTVGSTTNLGTGEIRFSLPHTADTNAPIGQVWLNDSGTNYTAIAKVGVGDAYVSLIRDTSGSVTYNSPFTFGAGDFIRISGVYIYK